MRAHSGSPLLALGILIVIFTVGCGGGGRPESLTGALQPSFTVDRAGFGLRIRNESFVDGGSITACTLEPAGPGTQRSGAGQVASSPLILNIGVRGARGIKALYCAVSYDSAQWHPVAADFQSCFAGAGHSLTLSRFTEPGSAQLGAVLCGYHAQPGFSGTGVLAQLSFSPGPAIVDGADPGAAAKSAAIAAPIGEQAKLGLNAAGDTLTWGYYNLGDYDQNGVTGLTDLTPLAVHYGEKAAGPLFVETGELAVIDGNADGQLSVDDVTAIGAHWGHSALGGYRVYHSLDAADYPTAAGLPPAPALLLGTVAFGSASAAAGLRKRFSFQLQAPAAGDYYWVCGADGSLSTLAGGPVSAPGGWSMPGHDPQHTRRSAYNGPHNPEVQWSFRTNGPGTRLSGISVGPSGEIAACYKGGGWASSTWHGLCKIDSAGVELANQPSALTYYDLTNKPAFGPDGTIYAMDVANPTDTPVTCLRAFNPDLSEKWVYYPPGVDVYGAFKVDSAGKIYLLTSTGQVLIVSPQGSLQAAYNITTDGTLSALEFAPDGSLILTVQYTPESGFSPASDIVCLTPAGKVRWIHAIPWIVASSVAISSAGQICIIDGRGAMWLLSAEGELLWQSTAARFGEPPVIADDGTIYAIDDNHFLHALAPDGTALWKRYQNASIYKLLSHAGRIYAVTGELVALDSAGNELWRIPRPPGPGCEGWFDDVALGADGTVLALCDYNGQCSEIRAYSSTGQLLWHYGTGAEVLGDGVALAQDGTVYFSSSSDWTCYALSPSGSLLWSHLGAASPTVLADGGILVHGPDALSKLTPGGVECWQVDFPSGSWPGQSTYNASLQAIYVPTQSSVLALTTDGAVSWTRSLDQTWGSVTSLGFNNDLYVGSSGMGLSKFNDHGVELWSHEFASSDTDIGTIAIGEDESLYFTGTNCWLYRTSAAGEPLWSIQENENSSGWNLSSPALGPNGEIFVTSRSYDGAGPGNCVEAVTPQGALSWCFETGAAFNTSPATAADGVVYAGNEAGVLYALSPAGTVLWQVQLPAGITSSPALGDDGTLYVGCADGKLYALRDP